MAAVARSEEIRAAIRQSRHCAVRIPRLALGSEAVSLKRLHVDVPLKFGLGMTCIRLRAKPSGTLGAR